MIEDIKETSLWQNTLAEQSDASGRAKTARDRLRSSLTDFRKQVEQLAGEIRRDMPDFTVHGIEHLDALWKMADIVTADDYPLNPAEAYLFGGAVLLHDLGLTLASFPEGIEALKERSEWKDLVAKQIEDQLGRAPEEGELENPPNEIEETVVSKMLRELHAEQAERLATERWESRNGDADYLLIQNNGMRQSFGRLAGRIAHSHWWPVNRLEEEFSRTKGTPHWCPNEWDMDPMKVAALFRIADVCHISTDRAPSFLRVLRKPGPYSDRHWTFQERLQVPYLEDGALAYTSTFAFEVDNARSWWLCLETLKNVDDELRKVDALLGDKGIPRLDAKRVAGVESPQRLVSYIPVGNWLPIDASVHVSDLPRVIENLGGEELYGQSPEVGLRELIQNSCDAVRARRILEKRSDEWGEIEVELTEDEESYWIKVSDSGVGMSTDLMKSYLLDFGSSYWGSSLMRDELPGLMSSDFESIGKYGVGFFSIFMLGESVQIKSRRAGESRDDTQILEFNSGLTTRPILRESNEENWLIDPGTTVRVKLDRNPYKEGGILYDGSDEKIERLGQLCRRLCPSLDVELRVCVGDKTEVVVGPSDWKDLNPREMIERILRGKGENGSLSPEKREEFLVAGSENLRELKDEKENTVGRAFLAISDPFRVEKLQPTMKGVVTVGGLRASGLANIVGILQGETERVSRDVATPLVGEEELARWADEQANLVTDIYDNPSDLSKCAHIVWICGATPNDLPVVKHYNEWKTYREISNMEWDHDEVLLLGSHFVETAMDHDRELELLENVIVGQFSMVPNILRSGASFGRPRKGSSPGDEWPSSSFYDRSMTSLIIDAISNSWGVSNEDVYERSTIEEDHYVEREVAIENESPVEHGVIVLRRPN
ncbi:HD domain-containing protein [Salinibacter sp.]|uniref:HD domain-containing protein n=1 Tax=Salinibacter sp. TaxID=2065818 RepID=UPI0021E832E9|nr:ATP-binding protein [Salinibacter sp.]